MKTALLLIDVQRDFCDPHGALYVPGAEKDCDAVARFIAKHMDDIDAVFATLDTHSLYHIAHPIFWKDKDGNPPPIYTSITSKDCQSGKWQPVDEKLHQYVLSYTRELEAKAKCNLVIWPPHCLVGSDGWIVDYGVYASIQKWEERKPGRMAEYIEKGRNALTEHYSAVRSEVPVEGCPETQTNAKFIAALECYDRIYVAGEALSHCVANTVRDIWETVPASRLCLLSNCTSSVSGFEATGKEFVSECVSRGVMIKTA